MKPLIFRNNTLQKEKRIKIPEPILDYLEIKEGDKLSLILDFKNQHLIIKKDIGSDTN